MRHEEFFESSIFFGEGVALPCGAGERVLEAQDFLLESLDVHLLALSMRPLCLPIQLLPPSQGRLTIRLGASPLCWLSICPRLARCCTANYKAIPRVVFFSPVRLLKKPKFARGLLELESLPIECHCPLPSISDTKPAELPRLLLLISEKHSDWRREAGEGYSAAAPEGGYVGAMVSTSDQDMYRLCDIGPVEKDVG
jgi:hypothetical protein